MSALSDALDGKNLTFLKACKMIVFPDNVQAGDVAPTYTVRIEAPSYTNDVFTGIDAATAATYLTEFTTWVGTQYN